MKDEFYITRQRDLINVEGKREHLPQILRIMADELERNHTSGYTPFFSDQHAEGCYRLVVSTEAPGPGWA